MNEEFLDKLLEKVEQQSKQIEELKKELKRIKEQKKKVRFGISEELLLSFSEIEEGLGFLERGEFRKKLEENAIGLLEQIVEHLNFMQEDSVRKLRDLNILQDIDGRGNLTKTTIDDELATLTRILEKYLYSQDEKTILELDKMAKKMPAILEKYTYWKKEVIRVLNFLVATINALLWIIYKNKEFKNLIKKEEVKREDPYKYEIEQLRNEVFELRNKLINMERERDFKAQQETEAVSDLEEIEEDFEEVDDGTD